MYVWRLGSINHYEEEEQQQLEAYLDLGVSAAGKIFSVLSFFTKGIKKLTLDKFKSRGEKMAKKVDEKKSESEIE